MNETTKAQVGEPAPEARAADSTGASDQTAASTQPGAERDGFAVIEALNAENAALKDRVLRTLAEMENLRRRTEREVSDARTYGVSAFARDMLSVVDNLTRALESLPENARAEGNDAFKSLVDGVELTARDLQAALARHGV
ncbi:MAG: nucleotide exchange factor GrpE, partial [Roseiarcus sp.]